MLLSGSYIYTVYLKNILSYYFIKKKSFLRARFSERENTVMIKSTKRWNITNRRSIYEQQIEVAILTTQVSFEQ